MSILYVIEKQQAQNSHYNGKESALDMVIRRCAEKTDPRIAAIKVDEWNVVETEKEDDDSADESQFDEELLTATNPWSEYDRIQVSDDDLADTLAYRVLKGKYKASTGKDFCAAEIDRSEWREPLDAGKFDVKSSEHLLSLLLRFVDTKPRQVVVDQPPVVYPVTKYGEFTSMGRSHLAMCKNASRYHCSVPTLYVVFTLVYGCCSVSMRPQRIYKTLEKAKNYCKKMFNVFACHHFRVVLSGYHGCCGQPIAPEAFIYEYNLDTAGEQEVYRTTKEGCIGWTN